LGILAQDAATLLRAPRLTYADPILAEDSRCMLMRVNAKCAHQVRPPLPRQRLGGRPASGTHRVRLPHEIDKGVVDRLWISGSQFSAGQECRTVLTFSVCAILARHAERGVWGAPDG
jgi:hypothetical protein